MKKSDEILDFEELFDVPGMEASAANMMLEDYGIKLCVQNEAARKSVLRLIDSDYIKYHIKFSIACAVPDEFYYYEKPKIKMLADLIYYYGDFNIIDMRFMKKFLSASECSRLKSFLQSMYEWDVIGYILRKRSITDYEIEILKEYFNIIKDDPKYDDKIDLSKNLKKKLYKCLGLASEGVVDIACNAS
ncbi:MAG: hypothetical protein J1E83_08935 [Lachnospiraceae bacterium]|nr:hypothetical protein [Lachnospiraceae bacterium]